MELAQRFGTPHSRMISVMKSFECPFRNVREGDKIVVLTDDAMDPLICQSAMSWIHTRGGEATLVMFARRMYHCADPTAVALTTMCLNGGTPGLREFRREGGGSGRTPIWLMEEFTQEILADGGGRANPTDIENICRLQARIGDVYDYGHGLDRGPVKSKLRLKGIIGAVSVMVDDTVVAKDGEIIV